MPKSMPRPELPAVLRYGAAIAAVAAAVTAGALLQQAGGNAPVVSLLLCAVLFAAWLGGLGPGLLAIALGALAFANFFLPPLYSLAVQDYNDVVRLISFVVAAVFVVALSAKQRSMAQSLRRAHDDLQAAVRELERTNASLQDENAERQRAEAELRESEKSLKTIIDTIPAHVVRYRVDGAADFMNQTLREFVGLAAGPAGLDGMNSTVHPDDLPQRLRDWPAHVAAGEPYENEMRLRRADGVYRWQHLKRVPLRDASGAIVNWYGAGFDIDDQKRAEAALREREAQLAEARRELRQMIDTIPIHVASNPAGGKRDFVNAAWKRYTGLSDEASLTAEWSNVAHPDDIATGEMWRDTFAKGQPMHVEARFRRADGQYRWFALERVALRDESGKVTRWYSTAYDIDDRKRAEDALRESEAQLAEARRELQAMIDAIPAMVASYDAEGSITYVNKTALDYTGAPAVEGLAGTQRTFVHPDDLDQARSQWRTSVAKGEPFETEVRLRRRDGEYRWISSRRVPLRDSSGNVVKWYGAAIDIEERKRAEQALRRSEAYLAEAQRLTHCGVTAYKGATVFYGSEEIYRIWGFDPAQGVPSRKAVLQRIHPDDFDRLNAEVERALSEKRRYSIAYRIVLPDGTVKHLESIGQPVFSTNGELAEVVTTQIDVTERKRVEQALRKSEAELIEAKRELQQTIDTIPINVNRYALDGKREFVNEAWKRFTGLSDEAARGMELYVLVHPDEVADVERKSREALAKGEPLHIETRLRRADGEYRWHALDRVALRDESGNITKWYGTSYDIEDRKQAEDLLRRSEAHLAEAQRLSHTGAVTYNGTAILYASEETFRIWGFDPAQGLPSREVVFQRIHPGDRDWLNAEVRCAVSEKRRFSIGYRIVLPDGTIKHLDTIGQPVFSASGKLVEIVATQTDVTDRKRAEDALRRSEAYLAEAQQLSVTGSFGWYISDNLIVWSQETYHILEIDPAVKPTLDLVFERTHPDDIEFVRRTIEQLATEERDFDFEHRLLLPGGTVKHLHVRTHRVRFEGGRAEVVGALMDVTASRKAEEALRSAQAELAHASRVATLGELSASIAHEVNQPLAAIVASGEAAIRWLDREVPEKERANRALKRLLNEAQRASQVIRRIRELAKKGEPEMAQVDINGLVEDVVTLVYREALGQRVAVRIQLESELPPVRGDRIQLQQVLINLVINGIQAMASVTDRARLLVIRTQRHGDDELLIAVEDAGVGIAPENLDRLFSAFYTTKPDGMGMGLSITRSILETHGGQVWATPNSGPGMTFQFTLPACREAAALSPVS